MKTILATSFVILYFLTACGHKCDESPSGLSQAQQVNAIVTNENAYRESLGQTLLSSGLSCTVQAVASGSYLSSASPGYTVAQALVMTGLSYSYLLTNGFDQANSNAGPNSIITPQLQPLFLNNNYKVVCTGQLVVLEDGYHSFVVSCDDGAILTVDNTVVVNNDGNHGITTVTGSKNLRTDTVHSFSLQYAQSGAGQFAMILSMDGSLLPAMNLFH